MRIIPWPNPTDAVARVGYRDEVFVAVPERLHPQEVLDLARLVLSASEFEEFEELVTSTAAPSNRPALRS